jgi:hypothetical protein
MLLNKQAGAAAAAAAALISKSGALLLCASSTASVGPYMTNRTNSLTHRDALRTMSLAGSRGVAMAVTHPWWPLRLPLKLSVSAIVPRLLKRFKPEQKREDTEGAWRLRPPRVAEVYEAWRPTFKLQLFCSGVQLCLKRAYATIKIPFCI